MNTEIRPKRGQTLWAEFGDYTNELISSLFDT